jgi:hypothetical protein
MEVTYVCRYRSKGYAADELTALDPCVEELGQEAAVMNCNVLRQATSSCHMKLYEQHEMAKKGIATVTNPKLTPFTLQQRTLIQRRLDALAPGN